MNRTLPPHWLLASALLMVGTARSDILAHWSFDNGFTDSSVNANDLTAAGGSDPAITTNPGDWKFGGGAVELDGNDWLSMTSTLSFLASDTWSVTFWGKRDANAAAQDGMIIGLEGSSQDFIWTPDNSAVVRGLRFRNNSGTDSDFDGFPDDAEFHHWAVVADGTGSLEAFRDGVSLGTRNPAGGTVFTANAVGQAFNQAGQIYFGQLDELYVFNEALSPDVVNNLYVSNSTVPEPTTAATFLLGLVFLRRRLARKRC